MPITNSMGDIMRNPVFAVNAILEHVATLKREFPQLAEDDELLADTLEGETDLNSVAEKLVTMIRECDMNSEAIGARIGALRERQTRSTTRMNFYRGLLHRLLTESDVKQVKTVEGNVSVVNSPERVIIIDETAIPDEYCRIKREPDKTAIRKALNSNKHVSGASLSNGGTTVSIR